MDPSWSGLHRGRIVSQDRMCDIGTAVADEDAVADKHSITYEDSVAYEYAVTIESRRRAAPH